MRVAIDAVAGGEASGVVSAGNTGALLALAKIVIKTLPGIDRPAMAAIGPSARGDVVMLDLGANVQCDARNLVEFAVMGDVFARTVLGLTAPSIGLLNVGSEELKGDDTLRQAAEMLRASHIGPQFHGFVEGHDIAAGTTDVVVTDGFTGNVALKTGEGALKLIGDLLRQVFRSSLAGQDRLSAGAAGAGPAARMARSAALQRRGDGWAERRGGEVAWRHRRRGLRPRGRRGDGHGGAPVQRPHPRGPGADRAGQDARRRAATPAAAARNRQAAGRHASRHRAEQEADVASAPSSPASAATCPSAIVTNDELARHASRRRTSGSASAPASASATSPAPHETAAFMGTAAARAALARCRRGGRATWTRSSWPPARRTRHFPQPRCASRRRWG